MLFLKYLGETRLLASVSSGQLKFVLCPEQGDLTCCTLKYSRFQILNDSKGFFFSFLFKFRWQLIYSHLCYLYACSELGFYQKIKNRGEGREGKQGREKIW